ncbi:hypothetical protein EJ110_NYTH48790 [Nymphaea thermarum]|nr:hypothetical protein EJ110_NYTH48790 [Nymphaea thermarum]
MLCCCFYSLLAYEELQAEGYLVDYERVPITDENSPKEWDFDMLVAWYLQVKFNWKSSRWRAHVIDNVPKAEEAMLRGEYAVIRSLIRVLEVEHMEVRLKDDIITEITQSGGRMLLHCEELNQSSKHPNVIGYWENVLLDDVKTPAEVYAALSYEGYNIKYRRIPLTREREALAADVDAIQSCLDRYTGYVHVSINCIISTSFCTIDAV